MLLWPFKYNYSKDMFNYNKELFNRTVINKLLRIYDIYRETSVMYASIQAPSSSSWPPLTY